MKNVMALPARWCLLLFVICYVVNTESIINYKCPSGGWMLKGKKCYKWGVSPRNLAEAILHCSKQNARLQVIESEEENEYFREERSMAQYWLGIALNANMNFTNKWCWRIEGTTSCWNKNYTNWSVTGTSPPYFKVRCAVWNSWDGHWVTMPRWECQQSSYLFLCEQKADCQDSYFGPSCSKQCHCLGEACTSQNRKCKYGCERGWTGHLCSKRKIKPKALYYCFNTKDGVKRILFRVDTMGTKFRRIQALDVKSHVINTCTKSQFKQTGDRLTIDIVSLKNEFEPRCGEERINDNTYKWRFDFKEFPRIRSAYDVIFEATCSFETSDSLRRSARISSKEGIDLTKSVAQSNFSVDLTVVDPYTGNTLQSTPLGTLARLVLTLRRKQSEIGVAAIFPHTCIAATDDGKEATQLMDDFGCQDESSPIVFENGNGTSWWSKTFQIFTFPGYDHVTITCQFYLCFKEYVYECSVENMCKNRPTPSLRPSATNNNKSVGTKLNIN